MCFVMYKRKSLFIYNFCRVFWSSEKHPGVSTICIILTARHLHTNSTYYSNSQVVGTSSTLVHTDAAKEIGKAVIKQDAGVVGRHDLHQGFMLSPPGVFIYLQSR